MAMVSVPGVLLWAHVVYSYSITQCKSNSIYHHLNPMLESDASDNSTRSTSSSFLKFQSRPKWRSLLNNRTVVQRNEDGSELPVENKQSKWPLFSQIYKRQNQILQEEEGGDGSSEEEESDEEFESELAPPAPLFAPPPISPITTQESGSSTCERSEKEKLPSVATAKTASFESISSIDEQYPQQKTAPSNHIDSAKPSTTEKPKDKRKKKRPKPTTKQTNDILTPLSIPLTICYSLRSAIGDGSARQRNSHALMERRTMRPNGSHIDCSHWSHRGKRSYMEGMI